MVSRCLVIGSARNWEEDVAAAEAMAEFKHFVVVKGVGCIWPREVDAWVTLHNEMIESQVADRKKAGFSDAKAIYSWDKPPKIRCITHRTEFRWPNQKVSASSGIFGAKVAAVDLGFNRVVLCGCPLEAGWGRIDYTHAWTHARSFIKGFLQAVPDMINVRSMSGFTREHLGAPTIEWLNGMPYNGAPG
jgi:hypothetical protein